MTKRGETKGNRYLFKTNYIFDVSVSDIFSHLFSGACLVLTRSSFDPTEVAELIERHCINACHFVPSQFRIWHEEKSSSKILEQVYFSGETLTKLQLECIDFRQTRVVNYYGPTETGEVSSYLTQSVKDQGVIGQPFPGTQLYVLGTDLEPVPIGAPGELYIGGAGLARGYLNRPELTQERFIANPFASEADKAKGYTRLYQSGDVVRWLADGNLEYLGRNDGQVKIRGHRIELGEIEQALSQLADVQQAVVIAREREGNRYLAAYVVPMSATSFDTEALRRALSARLPGYMVPSTVTQIKQVPLTLNGKLDRGALPAPTLVDTEAYVAPRSALEGQLCDIWQTVLGLEQVGIRDNFFRIGGNSITAIKLTATMHKVLGKEVPLSLLFTQPNVEALSKQINNDLQNSLLKKLTPFSIDKPSLFMIHPAEAGCEVYSDLALGIADEF